MEEVWSRRQQCAYCPGEGARSFISLISIVVTLPGRVWGSVGGGVVAIEHTKMTAMEELGTSHLFSLPSPQVRLTSLQSEV